MVGGRAVCKYCNYKYFRKCSCLYKPLDLLYWCLESWRSYLGHILQGKAAASITARPSVDLGCLNASKSLCCASVPVLNSSCTSQILLIISEVGRLTMGTHTLSSYFLIFQKEEGEKEEKFLSCYPYYYILNLLLNPFPHLLFLVYAHYNLVTGIKDNKRWIIRNSVKVGEIESEIVWCLFTVQ